MLERQPVKSERLGKSKIGVAVVRGEGGKKRIGGGDREMKRTDSGGKGMI